MFVGSENSKFNTIFHLFTNVAFTSNRSVSENSKFKTIFHLFTNVAFTANRSVYSFLEH